MARICRLMEDAWERSEVSKRVDVLAGFLSSRPRYRTDAEAREGLADVLEIVRESLEDGSFDEARRCLADLEAEATEWADHPHFPVTPILYEADAQVRDYAKDLTRGLVSAKKRDELGVIALSLRVRRSQVLRRCDLTPRDREDLHYVCGRLAMALDLGHAAAARRELGRLEAIFDRYEGRECSSCVSAGS